MRMNFETLEPRQFQQLTQCSYQEIADICDVDASTVKTWFFSSKASGFRRPHPSVLKALAYYYELHRDRSRVAN